jgi:hypothetical protein
VHSPTRSFVRPLAPLRHPLAPALTLSLPHHPLARSPSSFTRSLARSLNFAFIFRARFHVPQVFFAFWTVAFLWFPVPNYFIPAVFTMSVLCWFPHGWAPVQPFGRGGSASALSVLSSGEAGAGMPGLGGCVAPRSAA